MSERRDIEARMDRITLDVIGSALLSIAEEMGEVLIKSSYSSNIKERQDCSTAVFNLAGEVVAQAEHIPMHLGSLIMIVQEILKRYPIETLRDGDVFIGNDPYTGGSTHLPDITVASPVFHDGVPVGFVANIAHHADGSGRETRSIWDEGLRIPPIRIVEAGRLREDVMELLLLNFRLPRERRGDFRAQFAANRIGAERLTELLRRYGRDTCLAAMQELLAYGERKIRAALAAVPDGVYAFEDFMDDDGAGGPPVPIRVRIEVKGGEIALDFGGTGDQVPGDINVVYLALVATVYYALKALLDPTIPANGGFYRAIRVTAPERSIVNAHPPAPVAWRTQTCQRIADVVFGALAPALPARVIGATNGANSAWVFSGTDPRTGQYYVYLETIGGGSGARATKDGLDGVQVHITNTSNLPVECLEMEYPLLVEDYALVPGSGGDGAHRGGLGLRRTIRVLRGASTFLGTLDRGRFPPWGLFGGAAGGTGSLVLNTTTPLGSKIAGRQLCEGDAVTIVTPGAGGYGPPAQREPALMERDRREGKVSPGR
ncbi:MAG: hydantoinase B/oxoprolinase family protein [Candidatus Rokubacteria bacterium]|nr:hydantoinase B/oxoprolinase family protein [Candidatus Rokubacteria bacterium]